MNNSGFIIVFLLSIIVGKYAPADNNGLINNFEIKLQKSSVHVPLFSALCVMEKLAYAECILRSPDYPIVASLSGFKFIIHLSFWSLTQKNRSKMILQQFETNSFWKIRPHCPSNY